MSLEFLDVNFCAGKSSTGAYMPAATGREVLRELDRLGIGRALVWHVAQRESSAEYGNALLNAVTGHSTRLKGAWALLPPQAREQGRPHAFFEKMGKSGICALRIFPGPHRFLPRRAVWGSLLDEAAERRIPVFVSVAEKDIEWDGLYSLLSDYPGLVMVVCGTGIWGADRYFRPLVESYENVHLETSLIALGDGVMEAFVRDYGPGRLLFGSGFPGRLPESSMFQLMHAEIDEDCRRAVACGNAERLIAGAEL